MSRSFRLNSNLWKYSGEAAWYFFTVDAKTSAAIKKLPRPKRGWGSIRVRATVGKTAWETSIFPSKEGVYLLPIKASVRKAEDLMEGDKVTLKMELLF